jgi:N-ethylmaleimide reductase
MALRSMGQTATCWTSSCGTVRTAAPINTAGSLENRSRLPLKVTEAVTGVWGAKRVGYRMSPHFSFHAMSDTNPRETFAYMARELSRIGIGYIHLVEPVGGRLGPTEPGMQMAPLIRNEFDGTLILNGGYDARSGNDAIESGLCDLISFGVLFLANPDLPERFRRNSPLNQEDVATFYTGEDKGYTDYPSLG